MYQEFSDYQRLLKAKDMMRQLAEIMREEEQEEDDSEEQEGV